MVSKEEISRAKERISKSLNDVWYGTLYSQEENEEDEKILLDYIDQLENKVKELEKENDKLTYARDWYFENTVNKLVTPEMLHKILRTKYIDRDKIENKIAELWIKCPKNSINEFMISERNNKIEVLQELLEEK